jgi:hypothetical protein
VDTPFPEIPGVVRREDPKVAREGKLGFLRWLRQQIEAGIQEGLPPQAIEASCAPWGQRWAWENFLADGAIRLLSLGHFSRAELVRSFLRGHAEKESLPTVYETRLYRPDPSR